MTIFISFLIVVAIIGIIIIEVWAFDPITDSRAADVVAGVSLILGALLILALFTWFVDGIFFSGHGWGE